MGIFSWMRTENDSNRAERLRQELKAKNSPMGNQLSNLIQHYEKEPNAQIIRPFSLFLDVVEMVMRNSDFDGNAAASAIRYGEEIYPHMFYLEDSTPGFDQLCICFVEMFDTGGVVKKRFFIPGLFDLFYDPMNYLRLVRLVPKAGKPDKESKYILDYAMKIRGFCAGEEMFTAAMASYVTRIFGNEDHDAVTAEAYADFRHLAGIYSVSEERIARAEQKIDTVEIATERLSDALSLSEERLTAVNEISESAMRSIKDFSDRELLRVTSRINSLRENMEKAHADFTETQRMAVFAERDELVNGVIADSRKRLSEFRKEADTIASGVRTELLRANREASDVIAKTESYFRDNGQIREVLSNAEESRELNEKLNRLMLIREVPVSPMPGGDVQIPAQPVPSGTAVPFNGVSVPAMPNADEEEPVIPPVCPLLDQRIPFAARFESAMKAKETMASEGVLFHKMFDDVLTAVMENANPYLIGPSGCGKTFMVSQIAAILELEHVDIGYINEEYDILGFQTAAGGYSKPNFYRCYKYGKIAFCDELDNGNSRATVKLNSFLSNTEDASYSFPNGENVPRHSNFRIVAAGNTVGNGADANYNSREKIEESVQQRFTPIYVGYDNRMEEAIMKDHPDWFEFLVAFRAATDAYAKYIHAGASGIITTRDASRICRYLDNGSFTAKKIVEYEFIQTKDEDYLEYLDKQLRDRMAKMSKPCLEIYKLFHERAQEIINGRDTVRTV